MFHLLLTSILPLFIASTSFHAVHISYGDVAITRDTLSGEITFFKDDWYKSINEWYRRPASAGVPDEAMQIGYFKAFVRFWNRNVKTPIEIAPRISKTSDQSVTYSFRTAITSTGAERRIIVDSRAIVREFGDQMNLVTVKTATGTTNLVLTADHPTSTVTFQ